MELTVKELKEYLNKVPEDSLVRFQWIEDKYIMGRAEHGEFNDIKTSNSLTGWTTYDMLCDEGKCTMNPSGNSSICETCPNRNRYITATRCFVYNNQLFIDGHF